MPWNIQKAKIGGAARKFDARPDTVDLRDRVYQPTLRILKQAVDNRAGIPKILDQGSEGACTGFALAAVINYLNFNSLAKGDREIKSFTGVSPWMLYAMAKRYDRWPGEDYSGSSARGAMKGWFRHGVCTEAQWSGLTEPKGLKLQGASCFVPLGSYYRVEHRDLNALHAALNEVGIVYVSLAVHAGWENVGPDGAVPYSPDFPMVGGHAIALVGYDREGFIFQNSWGTDWGDSGFGKVSYDDWLINAGDAWVCQIGIRVRAAVSSKAVAPTAGPAKLPALEEIRGYFVNTGNSGNISFHGNYYHDNVEEVADFMQLYVEPRIRRWRNPRLMLYAHGGLNSETVCAERIAWMNNVLLANEIYPIHFMWETGLGETAGHILIDAMKQDRLVGKADEFGEWIKDRLDRGIEFAGKRLGTAMWDEMKENARLAFREIPGARTKAPDAGLKLPGAAPELPGGSVFLRGLAGYLNSRKGLELHLVGHSAGSILFAHFIRQLAELKPRFAVQNLIFFAPAVRINLFHELVLGHIGPKGLVRNLTVFNLDDATERQDNIAEIYNKSLLYLVSNSFEPERGTPLLGLNRFLTGPETVVGAVPSKGRTALKIVRDFLRKKPGTLITSPSADPSPRRRSDARSHGGFGSDRSTLNSTIRIMLNNDNPVKLF